MNARSKSLASIYSPRVAKEATVSTPLNWSELQKAYPTDFTMHTVPERLNEIGDLWADILENKNDLESLLGQSGIAQNVMRPSTKEDRTSKKKF
jgi:bifunctional non-homologous end joining protein LigD